MTELTFTEAKLEGGWLMVKPASSELGKAMAFIRKMKAAPYDLSLKEHREKLNDCKSAGFEPSCVCYCCKGKQKTHKGYTWRYADA